MVNFSSKENTPEACCSCSDTLNELSTLVKESSLRNEQLMTLLKSVDAKVGCLLMKQNERESQDKEEPVFLPPAAETVEELKVLAEHTCLVSFDQHIFHYGVLSATRLRGIRITIIYSCLLYTSDAADE